MLHMTMMERLQRKNLKQPKQNQNYMSIIRISKENYAMMLDIINKRETPRSWSFNDIFDEILVKAGMK